MKNLRLCIAATAWGLFLSGAAVAQTADQMIASADPAQGLTVFNKCKACHTIEQGGVNRVGPNLWDVVGRDVATASGYNYSPAMKAYGGVWTPERLFVYLADPRGTVTGTKMTFAGVKDDSDRAALIAYLQTQSGGQ